jgi:hypothetical protein
MISASISSRATDVSASRREVSRLAGEHACNDIGTVMLWPSASVVLLSSIDWRRPTSLATAVAELRSARLRKRRYTTSTDMTVPGARRAASRCSIVEC